MKYPDSLMYRGNRLFNRFFKERKPINAATDGTFLNALSEHMGVDVTREVADPLLKMCVDFALSSTDRGRSVAKALENHIHIRGKRFLDVGCAYGGFLVAFSEFGASDVVGIDINESFLKLATHNVLDNNVNALILNENILNDNLSSRIGRFDIITCNDVIEHVDDPMRAIVNLSNLLKPGGVLFMEIPNMYWVGFLMEDGHYKLPGITLLSKKEADLYYHAVTGNKNTVGHYHQIEWYFYHLMKNNIITTVLNEPDVCDISCLDSEISRELAFLTSFSDTRVPTNIEQKIQIRAKELEKAFKMDIDAYNAIGHDDLLIKTYVNKYLNIKYGTSFWKLLGVKWS